MWILTINGYNDGIIAKVVNPDSVRAAGAKGGQQFEWARGGVSEETGGLMNVEVVTLSCAKEIPRAWRGTHIPGYHGRLVRFEDGVFYSAGNEYDDD